MKKITLTIAAIAAVFTMNAQETISFESSEGYELGDINGQNNWTVDDVVSSQFSISDGMASDGEYSFFAEGTNEPYDDGTGNPAILGAVSDTYDFSSDVIEVSLDFYHTSGAEDACDIYIGTQSSAQENLTSRIVFTYEGNIIVLDDASGDVAYEDTGATYSFDTWYEIKILFNFENNTINYYLDDEMIYSASVWGATEIGEFTFLFDNFDSSFYIDNVVVDEDPDMSVENTENIVFDHYVQDDNLFMTASTSIENVQLFNILGQQVLNESLSSNDAQINISGLNTGVYLAKVQVEGKTKTFKFVK